MDFNKFGVCPYCGSVFDETNIELCSSLQDAYGSKYLDNYYKVFWAFDRAGKCLSDKTREQIDSALNGKLSNSGFGPEDIALLRSIKEDATALYKKLKAIQSVGFESLKTVEDKVSYLGSLKIKIDSIDKMDSPYVREAVEHINATIDSLLEKATEMKILLNKQASALRQAIVSSKKDIEDFLEAAGFPYELDLVSDDGVSCAVGLRPKGVERSVVEPKKRLSYGERNALAIALFSAQVKSDSPSLVVFDDPISSFDQNKKYAIIQRLFSKKNGICKDVTTLLLTHDFETLVMLQRIHRKRICPMTFRYAYNLNGNLMLTEMSKEDIEPANTMLCNIAQSDAGMPLRISAARRALELTEGKSPAWSVLSSLLHLKTKATVGAGHNARPLTDDEWNSAIASLSKVGFPNFQYSAVLEELSVEKLLLSYSQSCCSAEKICTFRILADVEASRIKKASNAVQVPETVFEFANEYFHIENLMLFQLDTMKFDTIPSSVVEACDKVVFEYQREFFRAI